MICVLLSQGDYQNKVPSIVCVSFPKALMCLSSFCVVEIGPKPIKKGVLKLSTYFSYLCHRSLT